MLPFQSTIMIFTLLSMMPWIIKVRYFHRMYNDIMHLAAHSIPTTRVIQHVASAKLQNQ